MADPDFHNKSQELTPAEIENIRKHMQTYSYDHTVNGKKVTHTVSNPFPPLEKRKKVTTTINDDIHERLTCFMTKESFISNPTSIYGYPIMVSKDKFNRLL